MRLKDYAKLPLAWLFGHKKHHPDFDFQQVESVLIRPFGDAIGDAVIHSCGLYSTAQGYLPTGKNRDFCEFTQPPDF